MGCGAEFRNDAVDLDSRGIESTGIVDDGIAARYLGGVGELRSQPRASVAFSGGAQS